ncbi:hypothetical protein [Dyadobacter sp. BHUBP1]|uniref:hypothetical protein n=1 Tax=Dyadobacter sp. BHUBP1 TaxID=3424178 RepID=UPI003D342594
MNLVYPVFLFLVVLTTLSCSSGNEKSRELIEANRLHLEAMKISEHLEQKLDSLAPLAKDDLEKSRIDSLKDLIEVWEENVIEVPGFTHAHDHAHGAHEHKTAPSMTDASMLDYQRQSKEAILELQQAITALDNPRK